MTTAMSVISPDDDHYFCSEVSCQTPHLCTDIVGKLAEQGWAAFGSILRRREPKKWSVDIECTEGHMSRFEGAAVPNCVEG
jgi:hypothetical protein